MNEFEWYGGSVAGVFFRSATHSHLCYSCLPGSTMVIKQTRKMTLICRGIRNIFRKEGGGGFLRALVEIVID